MANDKKPEDYADERPTDTYTTVKRIIDKLQPVPRNMIATTVAVSSSTFTELLAVLLPHADDQSNPSALQRINFSGLLIHRDDSLQDGLIIPVGNDMQPSCGRPQ